MMLLGYYLNDNGCGDNSCLVKKPVGMGTNGGCRCTQHIPKADVIPVKRGLEELKELRSQECQS